MLVRPTFPKEVGIRRERGIKVADANMLGGSLSPSPDGVKVMMGTNFDLDKLEQLY